LGISPGHSREIVILAKASKYTLGVNGYAIDTGVYSQRGPRDSRTSQQRDKSLSRMEKEYTLYSISYSPLRTPVRLSHHFPMLSHHCHHPQLRQSFICQLRTRSANPFQRRLSYFLRTDSTDFHPDLSKEDESTLAISQYALSVLR